MTTYIQRLGRNVIADEVFHAWTSGDLGRMMRALPLKTNPIDRHFLLQSIVQATYNLRDDRKMRQVCIEVEQQHLKEFPGISGSLAMDMGGELPTVPSFKGLATALAEVGRLDEAIAVCEEAERLRISDGTPGGNSGRAQCLSKKKRAK
jgi:hypothetical protein